jgi:hypothetical protein
MMHKNIYAKRYKSSKEGKVSSSWGRESGSQTKNESVWGSVECGEVNRNKKPEGDKNCPQISFPFLPGELPTG